MKREAALQSGRWQEEAGARMEGEEAGKREAKKESKSRQNFKVIIRVRPPLDVEIEREQSIYKRINEDGHMRLSSQLRGHCEPGPSVVVEKNKVVTLFEGGVNLWEGNHSTSGLLNMYKFTFDTVLPPQVKQGEMYNTCAKGVVLSTVQGYNGTVLAYGQTGSGKTHTMQGSVLSARSSERGVIPRAVDDIFSYIRNNGGASGGFESLSKKYLVRVSYLQIYNEQISDLLKPDRSNLAIREEKKRGLFVEGLSEWVVRSPGEAMSLVSEGAARRATGATRINELSSRSHAIFIITTESCESSQELSPSASPAGRAYAANPKKVQVGKLNLVDLAGSERVNVTGAAGKRLEECKKINKSLSALGKVISCLTGPQGPQKHIPYRDSKLTRILQDSLGGNCKTTMIATVSPLPSSYAESLSTLKFAHRAKYIRNDAYVNEDLDQKALLQKYEAELKKLRSELSQKSKGLVDRRKLLELEEERRKAEQDKLAAMVALEAQSREILREKEEKRKLEDRISDMQGQIVIGGQTTNIQETHAFREMLQKEHDRIRSEYEMKIKELESELTNVGENKAQIDRYKQLLLKQRDIMIALTSRLNERDEQILYLQEELQAYDQHQRQLEDALDHRTAELISIRKSNAQVNKLRKAETSSKPPQQQQQQLVDKATGTEGIEETAAEAVRQNGSKASEASNTSGKPGKPKNLAKSKLMASEAENTNPNVLEGYKRLQMQVANNSKERTALKTILRHKIRPLVDDVRRNLSVKAIPEQENIIKDVDALIKLVTATVNAMSL
ncbi:kinesin [Chloropicon primus]|nr:kinesin [Chloropicon primus]